MAVTSIDQLKKYAAGTEVTLPGFVSDEPFVAVLRRPSLLIMAQAGEIPNPLLSSAAELFQRGTDSITDGEKFTQTAQTLITVAKAALVKPTYQDIESAGLTLTDLQLLYIHNFAQTGVDTLKSFRTQSESVPGAEHGADVPDKAK